MVELEATLRAEKNEALAHRCALPFRVGFALFAVLQSLFFSCASLLLSFPFQS